VLAARDDLALRLLTQLDEERGVAGDLHQEVSVSLGMLLGVPQGVGADDVDGELASTQVEVGADKVPDARRAPFSWTTVGESRRFKTVPLAAARWSILPAEQSMAVVSLRSQPLEGPMESDKASRAFRPSGVAPVRRPRPMLARTVQKPGR